MAANTWLRYLSDLWNSLWLWCFVVRFRNRDGLCKQRLFLGVRSCYLFAHTSVSKGNTQGEDAVEGYRKASLRRCWRKGSKESVGEMMWINKEKIPTHKLFRTYKLGWFWTRITRISGNCSGFLEMEVDFLQPFLDIEARTALAYPGEVAMT